MDPNSGTDVQAAAVFLCPKPLDTVLYCTVNKSNTRRDMVDERMHHMQRKPAHTLGTPGRNAMLAPLAFDQGHLLGVARPERVQYRTNNAKSSSSLMEHTCGTGLCRAVQCSAVQRNAVACEPFLCC